VVHDFSVAPSFDASGQAPVSFPAARERGISRRELDGALWQRNTRGFYLFGGAEPTDVDVRIAQAVALLPDGAAIGGWASLYLQGAHDLDGGPDLRITRTARRRRSRASLTPGHRRAPSDEPELADVAPVLVSVGPNGKIRPRAGVDISRRILPEDQIAMVGDTPCVVAPRAVVDLVGQQPPEEGLVSLDAYLRAGLGDAKQVYAHLARHPLVRARDRVARLLTMADGRSRSCPESRFRWVWMVEAGLPRPKVNVPLFGPDGTLLGIPDLFDEQSALVGEYDGSQHRDLLAHTDDNLREERLERHNTIVVRATALDVFRRRASLVARIRAARRDGLARDRSRDRWTLGR